MGQEDREFVRAAQQGAGPEAEQAFAGLVDRWKGPVYRFLLRRVRSSHDAEELAADAFVEAWKSLAGLRDPDAFRPWLFRIAWRRLAQHYEARGVALQLTLVERELLEERAAEAPPEVRDDLKALFDRMPEDQLHLLLDKYESNLTYAEIAAREGISVSTVRDRLMAARDRLSRVLQGAGLLEQFAKDMEDRRRRRDAANGGGRG